jgi:hypothetical protein
MVPQERANRYSVSAHESNLNLNFAFSDVSHCAVRNSTAAQRELQHTTACISVLSKLLLITYRAPARGSLGKLASTPKRVVMSDTP